MSSRNLLVVISGRPDPGALRSHLREAVTPDMQVRVVASPSLSSLEWLTNDEDASRGEAQELADLAADVMLERPEREPEVGEPDTAQAVEDALRTFPADQVLVVLAGELSPSATPTAARRRAVAPNAIEPHPVHALSWNCAQAP